MLRVSSGRAYIHAEILLPRMGLRCSINSLLPTTSAYVYVLRDIRYESTETPFKIHTPARPRQAQTGTTSIVYWDPV
jgi:hypothetical protein